MTRIVITGSGAISAAGRSAADIVDAALEGRSSIAPIESFDTTSWPRTHAAEIKDYDAAKLAGDRKVLKLIRRSDVLGLFAANQAIGEAGFARHRETLDEEASVAFSEGTACYVGSGGGAFNVNYEYFPLMAETGDDLHAFGRDLASAVNPMWLLRALPNNVLCHVGIRHGIKGPNGCITNHTTSGMLAVIESAQAIRDGESARAVAAGHDAPVEPQQILYYHRCGLMAKRTLRPFDVARDGSVLGEGAAAVFLETEASARERDAKVIGEYLGGGDASEAQGLLALAADGNGAVRAIRAALDDAGIAAADVGMVVAHGNGTPQSDASEAAALRTVFGTAMPPVTAFKWVTGHPLASSGILDITLGLEAGRRGVVPGIATLQTLDPNCAGVRASPRMQEPTSDVVLTVCRGFGSTNAAVLVRVARER